MQPLVITLLIGTAIAMVNAAPAQQSLQAVVEGDGDLAEMSMVRWQILVIRSLAGINHAVNDLQEELAEQQPEEDAEAGRALGGLDLGGLFGGKDEEKTAVLEGDDDEAKAQFFGKSVRAVAPRVLDSTLGNEMHNGDDDVRKALLDAIKTMMQDADDTATA